MDSHVNPYLDRSKKYFLSKTLMVFLTCWMYTQLANGGIVGIMRTQSPQALTVIPERAEIPPRDSQALWAFLFFGRTPRDSRGRKWGRSEGNRDQTRRKAPGQFRM